VLINSRKQSLVKVKELMPGDRIVDFCKGDDEHYEVIAVRPLGHRFEVTFRSHRGEASAHYNGNAYLSAFR
jgi:hypothetical protein